MSFDAYSNERPAANGGYEPEGSNAGAPRVPADDGPPDELLEEIGLAAEIYERLATRGREIRFQLDPPTGRITVEVHDLDGRLLYTIPPSRALEIASGEDLDDV
jgi:hypothetical protein